MPLFCYGQTSNARGLPIEGVKKEQPLRVSSDAMKLIFIKFL